MEPVYPKELGSMQQTASVAPPRRFGYSGAMSTLALFLGLTASALATHPGGNNTIDSGDIVKDQVRSSDVRDDTLGGGGLKASDLRAGSVGGEEVTDDSLTGADVGSSSLAGSDIDEASLAQVPSALLGGFGRTGSENGCDPESATFVTCGATEVLTVPVGTRALIFGRARALVEAGADSGTGSCRVGASSLGDVFTEKSFLVDNSTNSNEMGTVIQITPPLNPGATSFGIACNQSAISGAIKYDEVQASVVLIAAD